MEKKARLIYTLECNRNCEGCCNDSLDMCTIKTIDSIQDLNDYNEMIITGGEPMLNVKKLKKFIQQLRENNGTRHAKIIIQTAYYHDGIHRIANRTLLREINGLNYTLHDNPSLADMIRLRALIKDLEVVSSHGIFRLNIDARVYSTHDLSNLNLTVFDEVRKMAWKDDCPLPSGEELLLWKCREES